MPSHIFYKNTHISYTDTGKGSAVVLLHGFLENQTMWQGLVPILSVKYRVITIDLLGHGKSECLGYVHTMEDMADAVYAVIDNLKIKKIKLIGHSMGGYVALAFAELYPQNVKGIALLNSTAKDDTPEKKLNRLRAIKAIKQEYRSFITMSITNLFSPANREKLAIEIEKVKAEALKTPIQGIIAALEGMKERKNRELILHQSTFPIALILGKKDPVLDYAQTITQVEGTAVKLFSFPDGHMSFLENQQELAPILLGFLKQC